MKHFLNNIPIAPRNILTIGLSSDFTGNPDEQELTTTKLILPREGKEIIDNHISANGIFEGIPYQIELDAGLVLDYYIDLTEPTIYRDFEIEVTIKKRFAKDNFFDRADGTTFELMASKGVVFPIFGIPYKIVPENINEQILSLGIATYVMSDALADSILKTIESIKDLIKAVTPNAGIPPSADTGDIISLSIMALARIVYTASLLLACVKLAQRIRELIFPQTRYFDGCRVKDLISKGCQYLGYSFQSNLLTSLTPLTILPVPLIKDKDSIFDHLQNDLNFAFTKGYPTAQDTTPTLGSLIEAVETTLNAKTKVINGVVQIERRDYWINQSNNLLLPALNIQDRRQNEYTFNTADIWKRCYIHYQIDYSDIHTADKFDGADAEFSTEPLNVINSDLVAIKGLNDVSIPFAMGIRRGKLNLLEWIAYGFLIVVDGVISIFGGNTNYANNIYSNMGITIISQQFFSISKLIYSYDGKQPDTYLDYISASSLYNNYHKINEITLNDYKVFENVPVRLSSNDLLSLLNNNFANINGTIVEVLKIDFFDEQSKCLISYKQPFNYANGKVEIITIND